MNDKYAALHEFIKAKHENICQIEAMKNGKRVYGDTWHDFHTDDVLNVMSVTKSVVSLLIGIATDRGDIKSIEQPVLDFFPDYTVKRGEKTIYDIKIKHLLTMTAPYKYRSEPWTKVCTSDDWTKAALDILGGRSGITGEFKYATLGSQILTGIIANASGMTVTDYTNRFFLLPLGIKEHRNANVRNKQEQYDFLMNKAPKENVWMADPMGVNTAGWGMCLGAGDMVKIGQMCLDRGQYNGERVVSPEWISEMTKPRIYCGERFGNMSYGYLWWIIDESHGQYAAIGDGGNVIYVDTEKNITVAVTGTFKPGIFDRVEMIQKHIVPVLEG